MSTLGHVSRSAYTCSKCGATHHRAGQGYCVSCHDAYMRGWRKTHPLTPEQRFKMNARCYLKVYVRKGRIKRRPCEVCGDPKVEAHHEDYSKPLDVKWLCKLHHQEITNAQRQSAA